MASILLLIVVGCSVTDIVREDDKDIHKRHQDEASRSISDEDLEREKQKTRRLTGALYGIIVSLIVIQLLFMWLIIKELSWSAFVMCVTYTLCLIAILIPWSNAWDHWLGNLMNVFADVFQANLGIVALWSLIDFCLAILCYYLFILSWSRDDYIELI